MAKRKPKYSGGLRTREDVPRTRTTKQGVELLCPFCAPTHPILPKQDTACGTTLKVTAVQQIITARIARSEGLVCLRCREGGGEFVKFMNGFVHIHNCAPEVSLLSVVPEHSELARFAHLAPKRWKKLIEFFFGKVHFVKEIDAEGLHTGKVVSYFFMKDKKAVKNGRKRKETPTTT